MARRSDLERDRARLEEVLSGNSEFGFGERAVAEVERLAWELVNRHGEVVVIHDWRLEHLRDPWKKAGRV